jgi:hypothetical protein
LSKNIDSHTKCETNLSKIFPHAPSKTIIELFSISGGEQDRTAGPLLAKQVLSQLSYAPNNSGPEWIRTTDPSLIRAVL